MNKYIVCHCDIDPGVWESCRSPVINSVTKSGRIFLTARAAKSINQSVFIDPMPIEDYFLQRYLNDTLRNRYSAKWFFTKRRPRKRRPRKTETMKETSSLQFSATASVWSTRD